MLILNEITVGIQNTGARIQNELGIPLISRILVFEEKLLQLFISEATFLWGCGLSLLLRRGGI